MMVVVRPSRTAAPPLDPSAGSRPPAACASRAAEPSGPALFPVGAGGAAQNGGGGDGAQGAAFWGFSAEDVGSLGYASVTEGIASIAGSVAALLQGIRASASGVTVRIELPASQPPPGTSVTSPLDPTRPAAAEVAAGAGPSSGDPIIPMVVVRLSRIDYEDRTGSNETSAAWQSPPGTRTGLGSTLELEASPFKPPSRTPPQEREEQRRAIKRIAKHVSILGLEVDLTSGRPMSEDASETSDDDLGEDGGIRDGGSSCRRPPLQSTHLLWGPEGEPGISMGISVSMEWEAGLRNHPESRRRYSSHPSCISVEVALEPFMLSLTPDQSPCLAAAVSLMRKQQEDGSSGPPPRLARQPSGGRPAGHASSSSSGSQGGTPERPPHPEGRPPRRYDDYLGAPPRHQSHDRPYGDGYRQYNDGDSWGRKSLMEELLMPDCERLVLATLEPCVVHSLSLAGARMDGYVHSFMLATPWYFGRTSVGPPPRTHLVCLSFLPSADSFMSSSSFQDARSAFSPSSSFYHDISYSTSEEHHPPNDDAPCMDGDDNLGPSYSIRVQTRSVEVLVAYPGQAAARVEPAGGATVPLHAGHQPHLSIRAEELLVCLKAGEGSDGHHQLPHAASPASATTQLSLKLSRFVVAEGLLQDGGPTGATAGLSSISGSAAGRDVCGLADSCSSADFIDVPIRLPQVIIICCSTSVGLAVS